MRSINETKKRLKSPLYQWHKSHHANMAPYGDYNLPLWYEKGAKAEHLAVLSKAGLFDTSHMTAIILQGQDSFNLLQNFFSRNLSEWKTEPKQTLPIGRGIYGAFFNEQGELLDDSIVYRVEKNSYLICLNSGKGPLLTKHLQSYNGIYKLTDLTGSLAKIDIQGPNSAKILSQMLYAPETIFNSFIPFSCKGTLTPYFTSVTNINTQSGAPLFIARSGYTREFGFEIFCNSDNAQDIWEDILQAGQGLGLIPCGLAARDSLRTGAGLPLAGQDIGKWPFANNPWLIALPYTKDRKNFSKAFIGSTKLLKAEQDYTYAFAGYDLRKINQDNAAVIQANGDIIGKVLTCVTDIAIDRVKDKIVSINSPKLPKHFTAKGLCCGFIKVSTPLNYGDRIILMDKHRKIEVEIVKTIRPDCSVFLPLKSFL